MDLQPLLVIVVGLVILGVVWRVVKGAIRLAFMLVVVAIVAYVLLNMLGSRPSF